MGCSPWGCEESDTTERLPLFQVDSLPSEPPRKPMVILAAATAKSLQSCLTLCDPMDGSPPGPTIPGILQARVMEWGAIAFSDGHP